MLRTETLILAFVISLATSGPAYGLCKSGQPASYGDINSVMFERRGCGGILGSQDNSSLRCSNYWLFFWNIDPGGTYTQYSNRLDKGTYHADTKISQAAAILRKYSFYKLSPGEMLVTDIRESVLTVRRCGVVTRIMMYPREVTGIDPLTDALFAAFDDLVAHSKKTRISTQPQEFKFTLLFDGK